MPTFVPPGGFAGFAQQTPATQALLNTPGARKKTTKKRATKKKTAKKKTAKKRAAPKGRLKKGSPEAKRRMAQIRKMRK